MANHSDHTLTTAVKQVLSTRLPDRVGSERVSPALRSGVRGHRWFVLLEVQVMRPLPSPKQVQSTIIQPWYGFSHVSPTM